MTKSEEQESATSFRSPGQVDNWRSLASSESADDSAKEEARKAVRELKDMLLSSLQMQHLAVLAGCGCSLSAGGPSMQDLWNEAVGEEPTDDAKATATKVNHDLSSTDIEALLSRVEAYLQVCEDQGVRDFLDKSKRTILDQCSQFLDLEKLGGHKTFLHRLSRRRVRDQRLRVFTTNYDLCFERAAAALGEVALDGFSFAAPRRYDPRYFGYDIIRRPHSGDDLGQYLEGVFLLYKLHGSVNWAREQDGTIYEKDQPAPEQACLIYPAREKYQQSYAQPHLESMAQYLAAVREPNTCLLTVGFGFNDDHLAAPLLAAVETNPHLRLIVVDPGAQRHVEAGNSHWTRLSELSRRGEDVWFINATFAEFVQLVPDLKSLTPAESLMKAIKGAAGAQ